MSIFNWFKGNPVPVEDRKRTFEYQGINDGPEHYRNCGNCRFKPDPFLPGQDVHLFYGFCQKPRNYIYFSDCNEIKPYKRIVLLHKHFDCDSYTTFIGVKKWPIPIEYCKDWEPLACYQLCKQGDDSGTQSGPEPS